MSNVQYHSAYSGSATKSVDDGYGFRSFSGTVHQGKSMKKFFVFMALFCLPLHACAFSGKALEGKVLEQDTGIPIAGAIMVARWQGHLATFAHGKTVCYHVLSTTSDENGDYRFAPWKRKITEDWQKNVQPETVIVTAYKSGYQLAERYPANNPLLKPFQGTREERLKYLKRFEESTRCNVESEQQRIRYPLVKALYEEAKNLAVTRQDKRVVNSLLYVVERMELGEEKAFQNMSERRKAENE